MSIQRSSKEQVLLPRRLLKDWAGGSVVSARGIVSRRGVLEGGAAGHMIGACPVVVMAGDTLGCHGGPYCEVLVPG